MASRKGSPNVVTANAKARINAVFTQLGGIEKMKEWAEENLTEFYRIYARLIPTDINLGIDATSIESLSEFNTFLHEAVTGEKGRTIQEMDTGRPLLSSEIHSKTH